MLTSEAYSIISQISNWHVLDTCFPQQVRQTIQKELGKPITDIFANFVEAPLATASVRSSYLRQFLTCRIQMIH